MSKLITPLSYKQISRIVSFLRAVFCFPMPIGWNGTAVSRLAAVQAVP
jgi:hypothetical protein